MDDASQTLEAIPDELGGVLLSHGPIAVSLDVQPPELLHELLPQEDAGLIPVAKLRGSP